MMQKKENLALEYLCYASERLDTNEQHAANSVWKIDPYHSLTIQSKQIPKLKINNQHKLKSPILIVDRTPIKSLRFSFSIANPIHEKNKNITNRNRTRNLLGMSLDNKNSPIIDQKLNQKLRPRISSVNYSNKDFRITPYNIVREKQIRLRKIINSHYTHRDGILSM